MVGETSQVSINQNIKKLSTSKMSNKKIKQSIAIIIVTYLISAFIGLELNPTKWQAIGRILYIALNVVLIGCLYVEYSDKESSEENDD